MSKMPVPFIAVGVFCSVMVSGAFIFMKPFSHQYGSVPSVVSPVNAFIGKYTNLFSMKIGSQANDILMDRDVQALSIIFVKSGEYSSQLSLQDHLEPYISAQKGFRIMTELPNPDSKRVFAEGLNSDGLPNGDILEIEIQPILDGYDSNYIEILPLHPYKALSSEAQKRFENAHVTQKTPPVKQSCHHLSICEGPVR